MNKEKNIKSSLLEYLRVILITLMFSYTILFFFQISRVHGTSMLPTYKQGDILLVDKFLYKKTEPERNDIIIVDYKNELEEELFIIKRVVGIEGDCVEIRNNKLFINGLELEEPYLYEEMDNADIKIDIPPGKLFVMGDNRNVSLDSREIGYVDFEDDVVGKVMFSFK